MINRALEWHRIVSAKPSPDTIERRTAAISDLVKAYEVADEFDVILQSVAGVVVGFETLSPQDSAAAALVYQSLKAKDPTVPQDITDNALELRAAAATALGETIGRNPDQSPDNTALLTAMTLQSALGMRPPPKERYLKAMLDELNNLAKAALHRGQEALRRRTLIGKKLLSIDGDAASDPVAAIKALTAAAKTMAKQFEKQSSLDREELEILWWLFSGASSGTGQPITDLSPGKAALVVGAELANVCLLPPPNNATAFVRRGMLLPKKPEAKRSLEKIWQETDASVWSMLDVGGSDVLGSQYPAICPCLGCARLKTSTVTSGWSPEFIAKTGLDSSQTLDSFALAEQVFRERIVQRFYTSLNEG